MNDLTTGTGSVRAEDGTGEVRITVKVKDGVIVSAEAFAEGDSFCEVCARAAAKLLPEKAPADVLGMRNDFAVYWVDDMPGTKLWCSALAAMACKRAAADYLRKNGIPFDASATGCGCI